jgi:hypothetical protein
MPSPGKNPKAPVSKDDVPKAAESQDEVRSDQYFAAKVIDELFGPFTKDHPELWAKRTYLMIVAKVYEHLVLHEEIAPKEMVELTKAFTESCKVDLGESQDDLSKGGNVLDSLRGIVRQVYGANLHQDEARAS